MGWPWYLRPVNIMRKTHLKQLNISDKCSDRLFGNYKALLKIDRDALSLDPQAPRNPTLLQESPSSSMSTKLHE